MTPTNLQPNVRPDEGTRQLQLTANATLELLAADGSDPSASVHAPHSWIRSIGPPA